MKILALINLSFLLVAIGIVIIGTYASIDWKPMVPDQADKDAVVSLLYRMQSRAQEARGSMWLLLYVVAASALFNSVALWFTLRRLRKAAPATPAEA